MIGWWIVLAGAVADDALPERDLAFLSDMTRDVVQASRVPPGSNGGGDWPIKNSCGFTLVPPGKDTYKAFWIRDFAMSVDSGFVTTEELRNHLLLTCSAQNGPVERKLKNGLHIPPWTIPDHINYNGRGSFFPGSYGSDDDMGDGRCGRVPPIDDHYEFVHIAAAACSQGKSHMILRQTVGGFSVFERLEKAFAAPTVDGKTGLCKTTEADRAVGFGFCDGETHTGKLLFASLLRYRAAGEMARMARAIGKNAKAPFYLKTASKIKASLVKTFGDPKNIGGWLRASTELSRQPDVWGTLFAMDLGVLDKTDADRAVQIVAQAVRDGTITLEGAVRQVPTSDDYSKTTAWERSMCGLNTYQNGGYWHVATGWLVKALWRDHRALALKVFGDMVRHLAAEDFRKGHGFGAPWEVFGPNGTAKQNGVYMASVTLPLGVLKNLK